MSLDDYKAHVENVRQANPVFDVVSDNAKLTKTGRVAMCSSPFRRDRDPSFAVYEDGRWYDFGISEGGDVFAYVMRRDSVDFKTAIATLSDRAGLDAWVGHGGGGKGGEAGDKEHQSALAILNSMIERRWVSELINEASDYYHRVLPSQVRAMVRARYGFSDEHIDRFRVGWASGGLFAYMHKERGESVDRLLKTGLFIRRSGGEVIDFFLRRIMFPYFDGGMARYMIGRRVEGHTDDDGYERGKYKKQLMFVEGKREYVSRHVTNILFGLDSLSGGGGSGSGSGGDLLVIAEGITDAMTAIAEGFACISPVTVTFRTADVEAMIKIAKRFKRVVIFNDLVEASAAGKRGAVRTASALFKSGVDARIVDLGALRREKVEGLACG